MKPYIVIVHKDADSAWSMSFPDAPGCFSASDDVDDLFHFASEALELWTEGMSEDGLSIPEPRELSSLRTDPQWRESFETAALVIAVKAPVLVREAA
jgi:predicted RNase H-like HicB family nuclease